MTTEERQDKLNQYAAEVEKIKSIEDDNKINVSIEDIYEARFILTFGFEAYWAIHPENKSKSISLPEMARLTEAAKRIKYSDFYDQIQAITAGVAVALSEHPETAMNSLTNKIKRLSEADE